MVWRIAADSVLVAHLLFIAFVLVGGFLARRCTWIVGPHLLVVAYSSTVATVGFTCPLTPLEKSLRQSAGSAGYEGGFIEHYIVSIIYPGSINTLVRFVMVAAVAVATAAAYWSVWQGRQALRNRSDPLGNGGELRRRWRVRF